MKKMISLTTMLLAVSMGFAQWQARGQGQDPNPRWGNQQGPNLSQTSSLMIHSNNNKQFTVMLDARQTYQSYQNGYGNAVQINQLFTGSHQIEIYEWKTGVFGKQRKSVIYSGSIFIRAGYEMTVSINNYGQAVISERQVFQQGDYNNNNKWGKKRKGKKQGHCDDDDRDDYGRGRNH